VHLLGEVHDPGPLYAQSVATLAPVSFGGGQQLKVLESLAALRVVIASPYSARSVPPALSGMCIVATSDEEYASTILRVLAKPDERWTREREAMNPQARLAQWDGVIEPLVDWIQRLS
jgi:hypothetical protein